MGILLGFIFAIIAIGSFCLWFVEDNKPLHIIGTVLGSIFVVLFICIPFSIHQIDAGEVAVVKIWGDAKEVRTEGIHFDFWMSHKYEMYDCKVQQVIVNTEAYSKDAQTMDIELVVQYQIQKENAMLIAKNYGGLDMLESRISTISIERMKSVLSSKEAMTIIETRGEVSNNITETISQAITDDYYINIKNVVLTDISFSDAFEKTVEEKMIAEQEKLKAQYEKEKAIIEAEARLEEAKREAEAILYRAQQEALAEKERADAEAYALQVIQEVWESMDPEVRQAILQKLAIENWNGELPETLVGTEFLQWLLGYTSNNTNP